MSESVVYVGSSNKIKVEAVEAAFRAVWPGVRWSVTGLGVSSGVPEQPVGYDQVKLGAIVRARAALDHSMGDPDYSVGLEGGLVDFDGTWMECGVIAVLHKSSDTMGIGHTAGIQVPTGFIPRLIEGETIDDIFASDFGIEAIGRSEEGGFFAFMTADALTRKSAYRDGVKMALARFLHPEMYGDA